MVEQGRSLREGGLESGEGVSIRVWVEEDEVDKALRGDVIKPGEAAEVDLVSESCDLKTKMRGERSDGRERWSSQREAHFEDQLEPQIAKMERTKENSHYL